MLTNPALNYVQFLLRAILPMVLHVVIAIAGGYAAGSEFGRRDLRDWLATANGDPLTALVGKLAPYLGIFLLLMVVIAVVLHGAFEVSVPRRLRDPGRRRRLLIWAYLCVGALFQLLVRNLAFGLSPDRHLLLAGLRLRRRRLPGAGDGRLRPLLGRPAAAALVHADPVRPGRARRAARAFDRAAGGPGRLTLIYFGLAVASPALGRPQAAAARASEAARAAVPARHRRRLRRRVWPRPADRGAFGLIVLAPIIYGVLYPQPYLGQLVRAIPIAVVDDDSSEVSRQLIQALNAHEAVRVAARPTTLAEAQAALARREVFGIVDIPAGTERDVMAGRQARLRGLCRFRLLPALQPHRPGHPGVRAAPSPPTSCPREARPDGSLYRAALARSSPVEVLNQPLFNPTGGYASYVVPAAFLLILQQTLLMGVGDAGRRGLAQADRLARRARRRRASDTALAHLLLALPAPRCSWSCCRGSTASRRTTHLGDLLACSLPFILSVSFLGQFVSTWFKRRETAVLLFIAFSLPLFFLVGVSWPVEAIPPGCARRASSSRARRRSMAWCASTRWTRRLADVFRDWTRAVGPRRRSTGLLAVAGARRFSAREGVADGRAA